MMSALLIVFLLSVGASIGEACGGVSNIACADSDPYYNTICYVFNTICDLDCGGPLFNCKGKCVLELYQDCNAPETEDCPTGWECVDYKGDECGPNCGGTDCFGICIRRTPFTDTPTDDPTKYPSTHPSKFLSVDPTLFPSVDPSKRETGFPSVEPSQFPSWNPIKFPPERPSIKPSGNPIELPTESTSIKPTEKWINSPTMTPTETPSLSPTETIIGCCLHKLRQMEYKEYCRQFDFRKLACRHETQRCKWIKGDNHQRWKECNFPSNTLTPSKNPTHSV